LVDDPSESHSYYSVGHDYQQNQSTQEGSTNRYPSISVVNYPVPVILEHRPLLTQQVDREQILRSVRPDPPDYSVDTIWQALSNILSRCLQPPVVGSLLGIFCAAVEPVRGIFVDLQHRSSSAPLQWMFDSLYNVGQAAVPINMMILGANLSAASRKGISSPVLGWRTMWGIVIGKMIVLPILGIGGTWILKEFVLDIPDDIDGSFYLVLMIAFLTPTANNVMVMVELSCSGAKEGMAQVIALQYLVAPIILSLTMTIAVGVADGWSY
jgi:predicted permease